VINGNTLTTTAAGTVTVTAAIVNGLTVNTDYTQDFAITISFTPVTGIDGVPTSGTAGEALALSGTVLPEDATNQTIVWSVKDAGGSGAVINGNTLTTTAAGTVTVTAAIVNGLTVNTDYTQDFVITITAPISADSLEAALAWIKDNAAEGGAYTYTLRGDETIAPHDLGYSGKAVSITLEGDTGERTVNLNAEGSLFTVQSGVTLTLGRGVTLEGRDTNTASLVQVNYGGTLVMDTGSKIRGNTAYSGGGGVYIDGGGAFTMNGGEISGNTVSSAAAARSNSYGGGVYVSDSGTFTMNGGEISGNTASYYGGGVCVYTNSTFTMSGNTVISGNSGGGVYVATNGAFEMSGNAVISGNTISSSSSSGGGVYVYTNGTFTMSGNAVISGNTARNGGGVYVSSGRFEMSGGEISVNTAAYSYGGGGVFVGGSGVFEMSGGEISGNTVYSSASYGGGGGVYVNEGGAFEMSGNAVISGNVASSSYSSSSAYGGGVYVAGGAFTMNGGEISGNTAAYGGGVYVNGGTFTKSGGGTIYGSNETNTALQNTATSGTAYGHAAYVSSGSKRRNTTAGPNVEMDSSKTGSAGGWGQ
jgi:hypothetical protein